MKTTLTIILSLTIQIIVSQTFVIKIAKNDEAREYPVVDNKVTIDEATGELNSIFLVLKEPSPNDRDYEVSIIGQSSTFALLTGQNILEVKGGNGYDFSGQYLEIKDVNRQKWTIQIVVDGTEEAKVPNDNIVDNNGDLTSDTSFKTPEEIVAELFPDIISRQKVGLMIPSSNKNTRFGGSDYVHIFLDGFGNPIIRSIPQGSPEKTYVVHVVTSLDEEAFITIRYNVKQTAGGIDDLLLFRNSGKLDGFKYTSAKAYRSYHYEIALTESNKNIVFEVNRGESNGKSIENINLSTHTIPIKIYNGSFDIGLISSELASPTYSFIEFADDNALGKIKKADDGKRGIVTTMATFYASPVILLEKFIFKPKVNGKTVDIPNYKLTGRNFVSDHKIYQRIYPTVGLSINEKALENIFYGFNFEAVRGASLFIGWHHGKVNTFNNTDDDFSFNESVISKENFDLSKNQAWKTNFAIGVNLDILVILNLLQQGGSATKI